MDVTICLLFACILLALLPPSLCLSLCLSLSLSLSLSVSLCLSLSLCLPLSLSVWLSLAGSACGLQCQAGKYMKYCENAEHGGEKLQINIELRNFHIQNVQINIEL